MGDPAGIGPEVSLKAVADPSVLEVCRPLVIGDLAFLRDQASSLGIPVALTAFRGESTEPEDGAVRVVDLGNIVEGAIVAGTESPASGRAAAEYIIRAVELWRQGRIDAITTAPINKKSLELAGYDFPGHTEFLADLTDTREFRMSFAAGDLRVVLLTTHLSLRDAIDKVKRDALVDLIRFTDRELSRLLDKRVSIAVAGLNPHASESGLFGNEEEEQIRPAVEHCSMVYEINVSGPFSPDTIFLRAFKGEFDCVIACYHDQATIPVKCLSFGKAVNITLGLPLIRTSVDHGTAFEIAGKGIADDGSMIAAVKMAAYHVNLLKSSSTDPRV